MRYSKIFAQAFLVAILACFHHLVPWVYLHGDHTPFSFSSSHSVFDETHFYASTVGRFAHQKVLAPDDVFERRASPSLYPALPTWVLGEVARILPSVEVAWVFLQGVLPALLWLLVFFLLGGIFSEFLTRAACAWGAVFLAFGPRYGLLLSRFAFREPPDVVRILHPALSATAFFLAVLAVLWAVKRGGGVRLAIAGTLGGSLFYIYYFYSMSFSAGLAVFALVLLLKKVKQSAQRALVLLGITAAVGLPSVWSSLQLRPQMYWILNRQGYFTHAPHGLGLAVALIAAWAFWKPPKGLRELFQKPAFLMLLALLLGGCLAMNVQVLTGYDAQHSTHFRVRVLQPLGGLLILVSVFWWIHNRVSVRLQTRIASAFIAFVVLLVLVRQTWIGISTADAHRRSSEDYLMLEWVRENLGQKQAVFGTLDESLITLLPAVTGQWSFVPSNGRTALSDGEILQRYLFLNSLLGFSREQAQLALAAQPPADEPWRCLGYVLFGHSTVPSLPDKIGQEEKPKARLDFLIVPRETQIPSQVGRAATRLVFENAKWRVLKLSDFQPDS